MTPQREAVLAAVRSSRVHPSAEEIIRQVRTTSPGIGLATVYRSLDVLVRSGRITELRLGDGAVARYDGNVRRHDHVVCSGCERVFDVEVDLPSSVVSAAGGQVDVDIDDYDLEFRGRCERCRG
ncbi:MAG: transcriptional repressor [Actinobacteria bacterium]|nr:transcriptional repressor [Actinomycetota bacterium]